MKSPSAWKAAQSSEDRLKLYHQTSIQWSELLRLPYWDTTTFVVLDCLHSLLLGDLKRHSREIALLLDLDSPPPNREHELWVMNKQALAGELWRIVSCYLHFYKCQLVANIVVATNGG